MNVHYFVKRQMTPELHKSLRDSLSHTLSENNNDKLTEML